MPLSPLDYRYGRDEAKEIWSRDGRHARLLEVERALVWAHCQMGRVSAEDYDTVADIADPGIVTADRVEELEAETRHDIMALTKAMAESAGEAGWCIHLGATSNDIVDSAVALQIKDSIDLQQKVVSGLILTMCDIAERERGTVMLGRTHGQAAVPITFGLKVAVWVDEFKRHLDRLDEMESRCTTGKFLGAVGTGAAQGERAFELQDLIMGELGLEPPVATTQVVGRDRYIEWVGWMANVATSVEKVLQEVRNLQRTEIAEVSEAFDSEKQVGSSTMAHKRNPITAENACGLARIVRSMVVPSYENALLWHERDLANSSSERFTLSHSMVLLDDIIVKCDRVLSGLVVDAERMRKNIESQDGLIMAEKVMLELVGRGMPRDQAHEELRRASMEAVESGVNLEEVCRTSDSIMNLVGVEELAGFFDPESHLGSSIEIVENAVSLARGRCSK
ncbi:MAG: adenylosuccinate lyase [Candidatus Thalassarchaeaceae archaeon]|jgi:adenylosuccinate lyase|nr:adenylosuccinate lyase [Candidatus Thalassarchaeaceae archaeon]MDP7649334.1 adenylosuccinate lyase [Candidatus Thalassarchaeaceae archaeon]HJM77104.1 adenylosuccinate lyase [Candidatus Thalassarchaeaceae archaeon]HJO85047.1 adenylosuccinate lyase [Candidatus Thalassarchaeaceae archaeon]|tara:strand:+ start:20744 stop:22096 length:1353 start_codon:yes stop_codon:yes gene_type:complete